MKIIAHLTLEDGTALTSVEYDRDEFEPLDFNPVEIGERLAYSLDLVDLDSHEDDQ